MTQNKKYPIAFKSAVNSKIYYESWCKTNHFRINSNLEYSQIQFDYKIHQLKSYFWKKILDICNNSVVQKIIPETSEKISSHISWIQSQYFSQARKVLQKEKTSSKNLLDNTISLGYKLANSKNFAECSEWERNIYFYKLIHDLSSIEECVKYLNLYYQENDDKKEEIIEIILQKYAKLLEKDENNIWEINKQLNLLFWIELSSKEKKINLILSLLDILDWNLFDYNTFNEEEGKQIAQKMFDLWHIDKLNEYYDLLHIYDEEFNFKMAFESSLKNPSDFAYHIKKFRIQDPIKLKKLSHHQLFDPKDSKKSWNHNLINHAHHFFNDSQEYYFAVYSSIQNWTTPDYVNIYENIPDRDFFWELIWKYFEVWSLKEKNFQEFLEFLDKIDSREAETILWESIKWFHKRNWFIDILQFIKENDFLSYKYWMQIYRETIIYQIRKDSKKTFYLYTISEHQLCSTKEDLLYFVNLLKEQNIISKKVYEIILADKKEFENMKNFITLILSNNILKISENNPEKASRDIFCEHIWIQGRFTSKNYANSDVQKFYLYSYQLHRDLSENFWEIFFEKLQIHDELLTTQNIVKLNNLLQLLYYFSIMNGRESQYHVKDLDFSWLLKKYKLRKSVTNIDFSEMTPERIGKIISQLEYILWNILHNFFPKHFFTVQDFETLKNKWWSLENIFWLIPYLQKNTDIREVVGNIIQSEIDGKFWEYKYEGAYEKEYDKHIFDKQVNFLSKEQLNIWRENIQKLTFFSWWMNKKNDFSQEDFLKNIYNNLINQKHFDELWEWFTQKVQNFQANTECIQDIFTLSKREEIFWKYSSFSENDFILTSAQSIIQAKNIWELKLAIQFFLFITSKLIRNIWALKEELKSYIWEIKTQENSNNSQRNKEQFILTLQTDNPNILLNIWNIVWWDYSCQDYKKLTTQCKALPWYIIDAWVKVIISFSISEKDFSSQKEWEEVKSFLQNNPESFEFNEYTRIIKINGKEFWPLKWVYRNILKMWNSQEKPSLFLEKSYKSITWDLEKSIRDIHRKVLENLETEIWCVQINWTTIFPQTRNPWWIYSDNNNGIMYKDYSFTK